MNVRLKIMLLTGAMCAAYPAFAQQAPTVPSTPPKPAPAPASSSGAYELNLLYTGEGWDVAQGGLRRGGAYMQNIDGQFIVDTGKAFGWTGGTFWAEGWYASPQSLGNQYVGALDQQSPIDTASGVNMWRLYQLYYDQNFGSTDVRLGIYDLETEFSTTKPMSLFLSKYLTWNTAFDQSGTMPANGTIGPGNYPYTPLAVRVRQNWTQAFSTQFAIANGAADDPKNLANNGVYFSSDYGALFLGEADYQPDKTTKFMVGAWGLTSKLPQYGVMNADGSQHMVWGEYGGYLGGAYRIFEQTPKRGLDAFFTYGASSPESTNVEQSFNAGLVYTGLLDVRPNDKVGISFNTVSAPIGWQVYEAEQGNVIGSAEYSFEATYRAKINEWVTLQPDIQYIDQPAYSKTLKNPLVFGIHFEVGHVFVW